MDASTGSTLREDFAMPRDRQARAAPGAGRDAAFLGLITVLGCSSYLLGLGFYWDDWLLLKLMYFSSDQGVTGLLAALAAGWPEILARPVQALHLAVLYKLFGLNPAGYHIANTAAFFSGLCLFYLAVRLFTGHRLFALATAAVYGTMPHFSTDRIWLATFCANLSMVFYFLSLYADLRQIERREWLGRWKAVSAAALVLSGLAYEVFLPFFLVNPLLCAIRQWKTSAAKRAGWLPAASFYLSNVVFLAAIGLYKSRVSVRAPGSGTYGWWLVDNAYTAVLDLTFAAYGLRLPTILEAIWTRHRTWPLLLTSAAVAAAAAFYFLGIARRSGDRLPAGPALAPAAAIGAVLSGLSYAYFYSYFLVTTGVNNRVIIAAAACVAVAWVSAAALAASLLPARVGSYLLCGFLAAMCGTGCLIHGTIASFWVKSAQRQQEILSEMKEQFTPPVGSTVLLKGACAWEGPGIVFETFWDTSGAIALLYKDPSLRGDLVRPWTTATAEGVQPEEGPVYRFESLYLYDAANRQAVRISDRETAENYIRNSKEDDRNGCLTLGSGNGLPIW